jgi:hypothetical protein
VQANLPGSFEHLVVSNAIRRMFARGLRVTAKGRTALPSRNAEADHPKAIPDEPEGSPATVKKADILRYEQRGENYALVRVQADGSRSEITLTTMNIVHLSLITPGFARQVLARNFGQRPSALGTVIGRAVTNTNLRLVEILLTILDKGGARFDFPATERRARALASKLVERADRIAGVLSNDPLPKQSDGDDRLTRKRSDNVAQSIGKKPARMDGGSTQK